MVKPSKFTLGVPSLNFLEFNIPIEDFVLLLDRIEAINNFPNTETVTQVNRNVQYLA